MYAEFDPETNVLTIPAKMSNSGSIHDLANDQYDIEIPLCNKYIYVVAAPSYYNITPTRHRTQTGAVRAVRRLQNMGYTGVTIIDRDCNTYGIHQQFDGWDLYRH